MQQKYDDHSDFNFRGNHPEFILDPIKDRSTSREDGMAPLIDTTNFRGRRYCCIDCEKVRINSPQI
jgi:hypothetical protein